MGNARQRLFFPCSMVLCLLTLGGCLNGPVGSSVHKTENQRVSAAHYLIGKGDILEIVTWKEPDFTREVQVRIDGNISFPLIADIEAAGRTTEEVEAEIRKRLLEYVTHPVVSVSVKEARSQRYYVMGEVAQPGEYPLNKELSVLQAFALAGGFTEWANKKEIVLIRRDGSREKSIPINYDEIVRKGTLEQNLLLKAEDILVVP